MFLRAHAATLGAAGFFHAGCAVPLTRLYAGSVIELKTRRVHLPGTTRHPAGQRSAQLARNLAGDPEEAGCRLSYLIRDRDAKVTAASGAVSASIGITVLPVAPPAPPVNAYAGRFVRTARAGCTGRLLIAGERHLPVVLPGYIGRCSTGRSHQGTGMGLRAPDGNPDVIAFPGPTARIQRRARLISEYRQAA